MRYVMVRRLVTDDGLFLALQRAEAGQVMVNFIVAAYTWVCCWSMEIIFVQASESDVTSMT